MNKTTAGGPTNKKTGKDSKPTKRKTMEQLLAPPPTAPKSKTNSKIRSQLKRSQRKQSGVTPADSLSSEGSLRDLLASPLIYVDETEPFRLKQKKKTSKQSKECEEAVGKAVTDFWDSAWNICTERFFITSCSQGICVELRNTWLRIVEAEWQDLDMRETQNSRPNRIFQPDEPPLPLAFDSWARGAIEVMPKYRRESVMDPFLRDPQSGVDSVRSERGSIFSERNSEEEDEEEVEDDEEPSEAEEDSCDTGEVCHSHEIPDDDNVPTVPSEAEGDYWMPDDELGITIQIPDILAAPELIPVEPPVVTILPARELQEESTTYFEEDIKSTKKTLYPRSKAKMKFSPTQCGTWVDNGVFLLRDETTDDALDRMNRARNGDITANGTETQPQIEQREDGAKRVETVASAAERMMARKSFMKLQKMEDDELQVRPLFEEHTSWGGFGNTDRFPSVIPTQFMSTEVLLHRSEPFPNHDSTMTDNSKKFLRRKLVNLESRFRHQTMKYFATPSLPEGPPAPPSTPPPPPVAEQHSSESKSAGDRKKPKKRHTFTGVSSGTRAAGAMDRLRLAKTVASEPTISTRTKTKQR